MRASKNAGMKHSAAGDRREMHISGAEGLYLKKDMVQTVHHYLERALQHPKGKADTIVLTVERIKRKPREISALPVATIPCSTPSEGKKVVTNLLELLPISGNAIAAALDILQKGTMRGAALIAAESGRRLEPDSERGVRVSRLGISRPASALLSLGLSRLGIDTETVREALALASKVAAHRDVIAEVCISDDPEYTTGYVASTQFGYVRIPHIKSRRSRSGGRAFFVKEKSVAARLIAYLERAPVIVAGVASFREACPIHEITDNPHK